MTRTALFASLMLAATHVSGADFLVTRFDDPAPNGCLPADCSLREATLAANATSGADRVLLAVGTYNLTRVLANTTSYGSRGGLYVYGDTAFIGQGEQSTVVRWSANVVADSPVFVATYSDAYPGVVAQSWSGMTVSHGHAVNGNGGCFALGKSGSTYTFEDVTVRDCRASSGGGISVVASTLALTRSEVSHNDADANGGGISATYDSEIVTTSTRIELNVAGADGGGLSFSQPFTNANVATWVDDGRSIVAANVAGRHGGGLAVAHDVTLVIDGSAAGSTPWLSFVANVAGSGGGAMWRGKRTAGIAPPQLKLQRVRMAENRAARGGAIDAVEPVTIDSVEFRANRVDTSPGGSGGAIHLGVPLGTSLITRSSFAANDAGAYSGGAIFSSGCAPLELVNVSMHANVAARGAAIGTSGPVTLRHVTAFGNSGTYAEIYNYRSTACAATTVTIENSLLTDRCSSSGFASGGGNQLGPDAAACPAGGFDQRQASTSAFRLGIARFGGPFDVVGWNTDGAARPQRNYGLGAHCAVDDVRGFARADGYCDSGAFEQMP